MTEKTIAGKITKNQQGFDVQTKSIPATIAEIMNIQKEDILKWTLTDENKIIIRKDDPPLTMEYSNWFENDDKRAILKEVILDEPVYREGVVCNAISGDVGKRYIREYRGAVISIEYCDVDSSV